MKAAARTELAQKILDRRTPTAAATLDAMGFRVDGDRAVMAHEPSW